MRDLYIIGYPKSGTTWLAKMIAELFDSNIFTPGEVNVADNSSDRRGPYRIFKEHTLAEAERNRLVSGDRYIYIVRDIRDVLVSGFFHSHRSTSEELVVNGSTDIGRRRHFEAEIRRLNKQWGGTTAFSYRQQLEKLKRWVLSFARPQKSADRPPVGNWSAHIHEWSSMPGALIVRYEDLSNDPAKWLRRISDHLSHNVPEQEIENVIRSNSFAEKKERYLAEGNVGNALHLRRGEVGDWRRFLSEDVCSQVETLHRAALERFDYL